MRNASVSASTIVAMMVAAAVSIDLEPHAAAQPCDELNPACVLDPGDTFFDPSNHTTSNVPVGDYADHSGGADLGLGAARSRRSDIALTPEVCGAAAAGAEVPTQSIVQQYAAILTEPAVCDGVKPLEALLHAVPGPVPMPDPQGVPQSVGPAGQSAPGDGGTTDPVDPVTGEFVHAQVDLALPSWGVPFQLRRVYRSRIDFFGPLGPGWDHVYNQRLANAPHVAIGEQDPPPTGRLQLGDADVTVPVVAVSACGPSLVLSSGEGTAIRFNEIAVAGGIHSYWSNAALLTLTGTDGPGGTTWTLRAPDGSVRHFDAMGRLVRWVDVNEIGLTLTWSGDASYARLESVIDSVGREIVFEYDADRLVHVVERSSGLEARYTYDAHGALWTARSADGTGERYEYDYDATRADGDSVPEPQLRAGCQAACARTDMATCDTGGACDEPVAAAFQECIRWAEDECPGLCHVACVGQCTGGPGAFYDWLPCDDQCEHDPAQYGLLVNECVRVWNEEGAKEVCESCDDTCSLAASDACFDLGQTGGFVPGNGEAYDWQVWNNACHDSLTNCCADGSGCKAGSCNAGDHCEQICEQAFFGTDEVDTDCRSPCTGQDPDEPPACPIGTPRFACLRDATDECKHQCGLGCAAEVCEPTCAAECTQSTCLAMAFEETCNGTCTESCIAAGRGTDQIGGTLFGHAADLNFNLVRIKDGAERLYLVNNYGTDIRSPDFDAVTSQQFGEYNPWLARWDLVASAAGAVHTPLPAWADPLIDEASDFEPVEICSFTCPAPPGPFAWNEVVVPFATDVYLVFVPGAVTSPTTGFAVAKQLGQAVGPTLVKFSTNAQGAVVGTISRRTSTTSYFATTATTLPITLDGGATVTLATSRTGVVTITGTAGGKDQLLRMGSMTLFTDAARRVQAYAGAPIEILKATSGQCSAPFTYQQVSGTEIQLVPATACTGELWLTPVGGRYPDQAAADQFPSRGLSALSTSAFHASTLAPTRGGAIWRQGIDGRRVREAPPTAAGVTDAGKAALAQYTATPMFSAPTPTSGLGEPLYVFHHVAADYRIINPPPPPSDNPWSDQDLDWQTAPLSCDPTLPGVLVRGSGRRPTQATAIIDFHGARWTVYADERNRELRRINHDTGAVWSFNYDPVGQLIGIEDPRGARTCVVRDERGNVTRRVDVPADVGGLPTPAPIVQTFAYAPVNSALTAVSDPRTGAWMTAITRDATGNPLAVIEAGVTVATFTQIGGGGPDKFQIASVTRPGNAVTALTYDDGTIASIMNDPAGARLEQVFVPDEAGRVRVQTGALGWTQTWSYDNDGPLLGRTDWSDDGIAGGQSFEYDGDARVTGIVVGAPGSERLRLDLTYDVTGPVVRTTQTALDGSAATAVSCQDVAPGDRVRETVSAEGIRTRYDHDGEGRVTRIVAGDLGPSPRAWDDGCLDHPTGGTGQFLLRTAEYDRAGGLTAWTDERGRLTTIIRDGFDRPVIITRPDGTQLRRGYDALGNVTWEAVYAASGAPSSYRPPSWADGGLHAATTAVYDARARLEEVHRWHFDGAQIAVGDGDATTWFDYDDVAHTVTRTDDTNHPWVTRYDAAGRIVEDRAPDGTARSFSYPGTNHRTVLVSEPGPAGAITRELTLTAWGDVGSEGVRIGATTHPLTTTQFDELLRPVLTTSLTGGSASMNYDAFGRVVQTRNDVPGGASETIDAAYDRDGRFVARTSTADAATTGTWRWGYDALGRQVDAQDPSGRRTTTTYVQGSQLPDVVIDPRGVQFQHSWSTGVDALYLNAVDPAGPDTSLSYVWSSRGDLTAASRTDEGQPQVANTFSYDSLGDRTRETDNELPAAWTRSTTYDGRGLPIRTTVNTTNWTRGYDALGRLDKLNVGTESTALATYTYAGLDFPLTRLLQNGVETRTTYDALGRLASQTDVKGTATLASWAYQVPLDGVPRRADFRRGSVGGEKSVYTVDAALRLLDEDNAANPSFALTPTTSWSSANTSAAAALGPQTSRYTLDGRSAWTRRVIGASVVDYMRDARDALTRIGTQNVSLDFLGAITNDGELGVVYDALGQVQRVTKGTTVRTYRRDAFGRIVRETDQAGAVTRYAWDGATRVVRQRPDGTTFDVTVDGAGLDEHVATLTGTARQFLHQDRRGSVYMVTNNAGAAREWTSYTAYGEATLWNPLGAKITASGVNAQFGFNGLPHDVTLGLVDMRARMYRPQLGRFLSPDPLGLIDGTNRFAFVGASPLSFRDPSGLCRKNPEECAGWSAYAGIRGYDSIPAGTNFHSLMHGVTDLGVADDLLRGIDNLNDRDPCNTGRGSCSYDTAANGFRAVGGRLIDVVQIAASFLPTTQLAQLGVAGLNTLVDEVQGQNDGPVDLMLPLPNLVPTVARAPDPLTRAGADGIASYADEVARQTTIAPTAQAPIAVTAPPRTGTYNQLRSVGAKDAHHTIQDAAVRDLPGYSHGRAPAVELAGPSTRVGSPHYNATQVQRQAGGGTYAAERFIAYKALRSAGIPVADARRYIQSADDFFATLGVTFTTVTRIPGNR